jgi:mono/diheme cytochrome c family protein
MTLLAPTLLALGLAAGPSTAPTGSLGEPIKAPVEITVPAIVMRHPASANPAARAAKPERTLVPLPPPPAAAAPRAAEPVVPTPVKKDVEVVATAARVPVERQPGFELVEQKCGRCHGMEKALNAAFTADDWDGYLKRKYRRAGAGITIEQTEAIGAFFRAWASQRLRR